ncbi:ScyD/ScyE family protein [Foetidibacter luteolus]|uniref:ScyD/ScyE family protein n=1 Tax=Foetidibacter luteolus TaxID=2608880 RepID=UPI00129B26D8|nr:ScyD/ScyE family protein [Foetidibacter luteolus]
MKQSPQRLALSKNQLFYAPLILLILFISGCRKDPEPPSVKVTTIVTGLQEPMGIETDWKGNIWVAETGTTKNDGKVVVIAPGFIKGEQKMMAYDAIINLSSIKNALSGEPEGPANLILDNGILYILAADFLYSIDVSSFKPGDEPIDASKLPYEDIGSWVRSQKIVTPNDSHPYHLIKCIDGSIYIVDAGANAIIKRKSAGKYSVFAKFPEAKNPTPVGPPTIQGVPTGIIFDGSSFLVSTLTGFPFLDKQAVVYKVSTSGKVSVYQDGLTTLTGITPGNLFNRVVLHFGSFGATGFVPNTGSLLLVNGNTVKPITTGLNLPAGIKQTGPQCWYITSLGDGALLQVSY